MPRKITLETKVKSCPHCKNAIKSRLRQHRKGYCKLEFSSHNGHCKNFEGK